MAAKGIVTGDKEIIANMRRVYASVGGPALDNWSVDELSVLTNMTVEGGLMTGVVEPCQPIRDFLNLLAGDYGLSNPFEK